MPTVVVRFETCKKATGYGTVYYRIYKGHNRRMEFSFHLHLPTSSWDETTRTIREEHPKACLFCAQIEADLRLLNRIITEDITGRLTMGDMIAQTAKDNNQMNFLTWGNVTFPSAGKIRIEVKGQKVEMNYPSQFKAELETIKLDDPRLSNVWGKEIYRITLKTEEKKVTGKYGFVIQQVK